MPRLTNSDYLKVHYWLRDIWTTDISDFAGVSERDQMELHLYFCPSKGLGEKELVEYRRAMTRADPSLPQRAGRALARFERAMAGEVVYAPPVHVVAGRGRQRGHAISVRAVMKPEPDLARLARALIELAKQREREKRDEAA